MTGIATDRLIVTATPVKWSKCPVMQAMSDPLVRHWPFRQQALPLPYSDARGSGYLGEL